MMRILKCDSLCQEGCSGWRNAGSSEDFLFTGKSGFVACETCSKI